MPRELDEIELKILYKKQALEFIGAGVTLIVSSIYAATSTTSFLFQFLSVVGVLTGFGLLSYGFLKWRKYSRPVWTWIWKE